MVHYNAEATVEENRGAHYANLITKMPELIAHLYFTREQIDAYQLDAFRKMLQHAQEHSPWHARRTAHIDPAKATLADLESIPPMTKSDVMEHWDEIVTVPGATREEAEQILRTAQDQQYVWNGNVLISSGGTGGRPGLFVYDWDAIATNVGAMTRAGAVLMNQRTGLRPSTLRTAVIGAEQSAHGSYVMGRIFSNPEMPRLQLSSWRDIEEIIPELNAFDPQMLSCYPTHIPGLAAAVRRGDLTIKPLGFLFGSEYLSPENYDLAVKTWPGASILTAWATSEGAGTFACSAGKGAFHICEDLVILEPIDANGLAVPAGQQSDGIYLTNLFNKALPIIRYYIDDLFTIDPDPCECGSPYQRVKTVAGRGFEKFNYGGVLVHPLAIELAVLQQPNIVEYQIRQTLDGVHLFYRPVGDVDESLLRTKIENALASYGLDKAEILIEQTEHIERTALGKMRRFVALPTE
jgi:phenylacetate-CoA ligase